MSLFGRRQPDSPSRDRSAEERERARLEREARRAAREGRPAPPPPPPPALRDDDPFAGVEPEATPPADDFAADLRDKPDPFELEDPPASPTEPTAVVQPPADDIDEDPFAPAEPSARAPREAEPPVVDEPSAEPVPADPPQAREPLDQPTVAFDVPAHQEVAVPEPEPEPDSTFSRWGSTGMTEEQPAVAPADPAPAPVRSARFGDEDERPVPPKRVSRRTLPPPPPPPGEPRKRGRPRRGRVLGILALLLIAGAAWLANTIWQPFKGDGGETVSVMVPTDSTADEVGDILAENGIVDSAFVFTLRSRLSGASLQAGTYRLKKDSSYGDTIAALEQGPPAVRTINVTIPEGRSRREAQPLIKQAGLEGSYLEASEKPTADFRLRRYGAPRNLASLEGFLFPATYELRPGASARRLVADQLDAFRRNIANVSMRRARARNLSTYEVLIIASMVEREAQVAKERRLISAVIHNRLEDGMPLGIDATIRFATRNWSRPLKESELAIDSPYNTRQRAGLPPGPIGSPGLASIKAAANPADRDFLYYVVKPGTCGEHAFSATDAEFQEDVAAYNEARDRAGGKSPTTC